jgi:hypothetical protein
LDYFLCNVKNLLLINFFNAFHGYIPEILEKPIKGLTGIVSAGVLGILGFLILGAARMTKAGGKKATTGGIFLLILGLVAYLVGGAIGAVIAILTGLLTIIARYVYARIQVFFQVINI